MAITPNVPVGGLPAAHWTVTPGLPAGLTLDPNSGVISGTPTAVTQQLDYEVSASGTGFQREAQLRLTVNDVPPSGLAYSPVPATYTKGVAIAPSTPSSQGGAVVRYTVSPTLPPDLQLDSDTGVLSGTPTAVTLPGDYLVTASNSGGDATVTLHFAVQDAPESSFGYQVNPAVYTLNEPITSNPPTGLSGGTVSFSVSPDLPTGLLLDPTQGFLSGTPTVLSPAANYTVTAVFTGGTGTSVLSIAVNDLPPSGLSYATNPAVYLRWVAIGPNQPTTASGGPVVSYSVAPALPDGLTLDADTGVVSGTPVSIASAQDYTVTASNSGGSTSALLNLAVPDGDPTLGLPVGIPDAAGTAALVSEHNKARQGALSPAPDPSLNNLVWDPLLAQVAYSWGLQCQAATGTGILGHNPNRGTDYVALGGATTIVGENIYGTSGSVVVGSVLGSWMAEAAYYTYSTNTCAAGQQCGHYTQIVWRTTTRVGCAVVNCPNLSYPNNIVCDYWTAGNFPGQQPY